MTDSFFMELHGELLDYYEDLEHSYGMALDAIDILTLEKDGAKLGVKIARGDVDELVYERRSINVRYEAALEALVQEKKEHEKTIRVRDQWHKLFIESLDRTGETSEKYIRLSQEHDAMSSEVNLLRARYHALKESYDRLLDTVKELQ